MGVRLGNGQALLRLRSTRLVCPPSVSEFNLPCQGGPTRTLPARTHQLAKRQTRHYTADSEGSRWTVAGQTNPLPCPALP